MGIFGQLLEKPVSETRSHPANPSDATLAVFAGGSDTKTGIAVDEATAMTFTTVYVCQKILAESVGMLPLHVYKRRPDDDGRDKAVDHPNYILLNQGPNAENTPYEFWGFMTASLALWGNAYAQIMRKGNVLYGKPEKLIPLYPGRMKVARVKGKIIYTYRQANGENRAFFQQEILHIRNVLTNGLKGYSPVQVLRDSIALGMATQEFAERFYENDATPSTVVIRKGAPAMSTAAVKNFREAWNDQHKGLKNKHNIGIIPEEMDIKTIGMPLKDAEFLELMKYSKRDIASIWRIPLNLLNDWEYNTFTNATEMVLVYHKDVLLPVLTCIQQAIHRDLFTKEELKTYYCEFLPDALLRGDTAQRFSAYGEAIDKGFMKPNEARAKENWNPEDGGDVLLFPTNHIPSTQIDQMGGQGDKAKEETKSIRAIPTQEERASRSAKSRRKAIERMQPLIADAARRVVNREVIDVRKKAKSMLQSRAAADFKGFLQKFYKDYPATVDKHMESVFLALSKEVHGLAVNEIDSETPLDVPDWNKGYTKQYGIEHSDNSRNQLLAILDDTEPEKQFDAIDKRLSEWEEKRADKVADRQGNNLASAMATAVFVAGGITRKVWVTSGKPCPLCEQMAGRTVSVSGSFLKPGDTVNPTGDTAPLNVQRDFAHPPLHNGCTCSVVAG